MELEEKRRATGRGFDAAKKVARRGAFVGEVIHG